MGFWTLFLIYLAGFFLIIVDIFLPGGILATFGGITLAAGIAITYYLHGAAWGTTALVSSLIAAVALVVAGYQLVSKTRLGNRVFLHPGKTGNRDAAPAPVASVMGKQGVTLTDLRPAGRVRVGEEPFDALTTGRFIPAGRRVVVVAIEMNSLVVEEV